MSSRALIDGKRPAYSDMLVLLYSQAQKAENALHVSKGEYRFRDPRHGGWVEHYACTTSLVSVA